MLLVRHHGVWQPRLGPPPRAAVLCYFSQQRRLWCMWKTVNLPRDLPISI